MRNFPRISRINGKCQIFRGGGGGGAAAAAPFVSPLFHRVAAERDGKEKRKMRNRTPEMGMRVRYLAGVS